MLYATSLVSLKQGNDKKSEKLMTLININRENLEIFSTSWGIPMKFSGKTCLVIILKFSKKQGFTLSLEDTFFAETTADPFKG